MYMADREEGEGAAHRGSDWEVVSLTASAYAASPGPKEFSLNKSSGDDEAETSRALFLSEHFIFPSEHFVFPPSQHENLPLEPEHSKTHNEKVVDGYCVVPLVTGEDDKSLFKNEEILSIEGLMSREFPGIQIFDGKGNMISTNDVEFGKDVIHDKVKSTMSTKELHSFHCETMTGKPYIIREGKEIHGTHGPEELESDSGSQNPVEGPEHDEDDLPCEAWWKRRALSLYVHAKETNTFWSVFIAAAVLGIVIIGQKWQQERWKVFQLKGQFGISDEKMERILGPISRLKDVIVSGHRRSSLIRGSTSNEH